MSAYSATWRTASRDYRCDGSGWRGEDIVQGDRYLVVTVLRSDVVKFGTRVRYCATCAVERGYQR